MNQTNGPLMFSWPLYDYEYDIPSLKPLLEEHPILVGNSRDLPDDLKKVLGKQGILSFIISPVFRDGKKIGIVGMAFCEKECQFSDDHLFIINGLAGLVSLILDRKQFHTMRCKLNTIKACVDELGPCIEGPVADDSESIQQNKATTLVDAEKRLIAETLELHNGNKLKTTKHLGLTWPSLDRRCKKLGIDVKRR